MWRQTYNVKHLLHFLRDHTYRDLPPALYDRYLWLYTDVEEFLHRLETTPREEQALLFEAIEDDRVEGVATVFLKENTLQIRADASQPVYLAGLLELLTSRLPEKHISLSVCRRDLALSAEGLLHAQAVPGKVKYYTCQEAPLSDLPVKEMGYEDEYPSQWSNYQQFLFLGERIFGLKLDGRMRTMCGLLQLTAYQTQIVAVETFDEADRRKGYSKAVCAFALREGLQEAPIVTWSTSLVNLASCATAESLGMKPYYGLYEIRGVL